jgi:hypothetical protein
MKKRFLITLTAIAAVFILAAPAFAAIGQNGVVFNSAPDTLPGNTISWAFQATQTSEFGDGIKFTPSPKKHLSFVKVVMSSWACESGSGSTCVTTPGSTFTHPITFNIYHVDSGGLPGTLIATRTQTFTLKFRPTSDDGSNCGGDNTAWFSAADSACYHGLAQKITFNFKPQHLVLPNSIVYGIAYNTSDYGYNPIGVQPCNSTTQGCPYDSLNVGSEAGLAKRGMDRYPDGTFLNSSTAGNYCDGGTGGTGTFRLDDGCWSGQNPLVLFRNVA